MSCTARNRRVHLSRCGDWSALPICCVQAGFSDAVCLTPQVRLAEWYLPGAIRQIATEDACTVVFIEQYAGLARKVISQEIWRGSLRLAKIRQ
jgi:hypothetical protein